MQKDRKCIKIPLSYSILNITDLFDQDGYSQIRTIRLIHEGFVTFHRYLTSKVTSTIPDSGMLIFLNNHEIKQKYTIILGMSNS